MNDLELALHYIPRPERQLVADLFALDAELGRVVETTTEPMIGRIRLAWWRERLQELDQDILPPEPHLQAAFAIMANAEGVNGAALGSLADGWEPLLPPFPCPPDTPGLVSGRGFRLFQMAAAILGASSNDRERAGVAGAIWAMVDAAKRTTCKGSGEYLLTKAREVSESWRESVVPVPIRPLVMLGLLARRDLKHWPDLEREATPGRAWVMIRHWLTGKL